MDRVQVIIWLRYRLLVNRLRRGEGVWQLVGAVAMALVWSLVSLGAAAGVGAVMLKAVHQGEEPLLFKLQVGVFLVAALAGVLFPLFVEKGQGSPVTARLLAFPFTPRKLFWMSQTALAGSADHLFYYPVLIMVAVAVVTGPGSWALGIALVLSLWLSILVWAHAVGLGTEVLLRGRRSREVLAVVVILLILAMGMGPGIIEQYLGERSLAQVPVLQHALAVVIAMGRTTAPYQAAAGLQDIRSGILSGAATHLMGVWLWVLAGLMMAQGVFLRFYLGDKGRVGPPRASAPAPRPAAAGWLWEYGLPVGPLPPAVAANAIKDLRVILRSLAGRLILVLAPLLMAFIGWSVLKDVTEAFLGLQTGELRFFGMLVYVSLTANNQSINNMAYEGSGVQSFFLLPAPLSAVLLGKNLGMWLYQFLVLVICLVVLGVVGSWPHPATFVSGVLLYGALIVYRTLMGNVLSCLFPAPRALSSRKDMNRGAAMGNLISFGGFLLYVPLAWLFAALPLLAGHPAWQPLGLGALLLLTGGLYLLSLKPVAGLMMDRREKIIAALRRPED